MTLKDIVRLNSEAAEYFLVNIHEMPEDRQDWSPLEKGRSAVNQLAEAVQFPMMCVRIFQEGSAEFHSDEWLTAERAWREQFRRPEQLEEMFRQSMAKLNETLLAAKGRDLGEVITFPSGFQITLERVAWWTLQNLWYHYGQINYIQTLYGDQEMHRPSTVPDSAPLLTTAKEFRADVEWLVEDGLDQLLASARAMPEDRWAWRPYDSGRSMLDQLAECRQVPEWFMKVFETKSLDHFTPEFMEEEHNAREQYESLDQLEEELREVYGRFVRSVARLSKADLLTEVPSRRGPSTTIQQFCLNPPRNLVYHAGQINYIQTLYGDSEMH